VIITGRDQERLEAAVSQIPGAIAIAGDVSNAEDTANLVQTLNKEFPALSLVINNAGRANISDLSVGVDVAGKAQDEMVINYFSVLRLNELLLPLLKAQPEAAIVNVTSIVSIVPSGSLATYSASKAALRSYTHALRLSLSNTNVMVFELMPPLVNTAFSAEIGGNVGIAPSVVAAELLTAITEDRYEIRVGNTQHIYDLYLKSPEAALMALNG